MAQVRKFQSGGKTFKINGKTYNTSNSEDMKRLEEMTSNSEYGGIAQQILANVNDAAYDNTLNVYRTSDGRVMMEGSLQNVADQYMSQSTQKATQRKDNAWNNTFKRKSGKEWINGLDSFITNWDSKSSSSSSSSSTSSSSNDKIKISGVSGLGGQWKYNDQGWDEASNTNNAMLKELQLLEEYYNASEEDRKNKYDVSGLDKRSLEAYINMRQNDPTLYSKYLESFKADAPALDNNDFYSTYGWFGFTQDPDVKKTTDNKALKTYLATQGLDFEGAENVFYRDKDGNLMVTDAFLTNVLGGDKNGHYWLNDNWANLKTDTGNPNPYSQMRNHIIWNGRIYKQDDAAVLAELQKSGYIDANKAYDATKAEQIMRTQWSDNPTFAHEAFDFNKMYSDWAQGYKDKGLRYRALESIDLPDNQQLIEYYSDADGVDQYGFRTPKYAIVGKDGKLVQDNVDPTQIGKKDTNGRYISSTASFMAERLGEDAGMLAGTYIDGTSVDGKPSNTFFYQNPDTGEFFIQDPELKGAQKGKVVRIPKEIADIVPRETWEYFRTNKGAKDRLFRLLKQFTNSGFASMFSMDEGLLGLLGFGPSDNLVKDFQKAGLTKDQAEDVVDLLNKWGTNKYYREQTGKDSSRTTRQQSFLADPKTEGVVQPFKVGGKMTNKIGKYQYGSVLGNKGTTKAMKATITSSDVKDANLSQSYQIGDPIKGNWSSLDTTELIATLGDLGSLALSFVPGAHYGAAGVGAAASTANFVTDIKRDGFQGRDLLNYGANLGLDVLSAFTGAGGKTAKIMKNFPKAAKLLSKAIKAGAILGLSDAVVNSVNKIANGEKFTLSDVRRIANGVAGAATLTKTGLFNQRKGKITRTDPSIIKGKKEGVPEIKIDTKKINESSKADQLIELQSQVTAGYRAQNKNTNLTDDQILELYDIPTKKTTDFKWKVWKSSREVVPDLKSKFHRPDLKESDLNKLASERNGLQNWFYGTGKKQRLFNGMFEGNNPLVRQEIVMPENTTPRLINLNVPAVVRQIPGIRNSYINLPNIVSTQQFPQEMEFVEDVYVTPMERLVFKEGGVLKGQKGLWDLSKELVSGVDVSKLGQPQYEIGDNGVVNNNLNIAEMAQRASTPKVELPETKSPIATDYAKDHAYGSGNETAATKQVGDYWSQRRATEQFGGRPTKDNNFEWGYLAKEMAGIGNSLAARMDAKKFLDLSNQKADIYSKGQPTVWNGRGRTRFQTPTMNLVNQQIAANNTIAGTMNTADPKANIAGKLSLAETNSKLFNQGLGMVSQELTNQLNAYNAQRREDDKLTFETANNARQWAMNAGMLRNAGQTEYTTNMGAIRDKDFVKLQSDINRFGMIDAQKQTMIDKYNLQRNTPGLSADQIASIDARIAQIKSPEYNNILRRQAMYGSVASAKKGTKLRSTTEQMLLDNNKAVTKAISKLSDNTMKLILKAMS